MPVKIQSIARPAALLVSVSAAAVALSACKIENRPLLARDDGYRPAAAALPYQQASYGYYGLDMLELPQAQPARIMPIANPRDAYAFAERAYAYDRAAYRAPPDYGFDYYGYEEDPWAWQLANDSLMFAEPYGDDAYRFYYYEPGEAYPYFVRDPYYGYAYGEDGALMAMFTAAGALLTGTDLGQWADVAGSYLVRGHDLHNVYYRSPRYEIADPLWIERAPILYAYQEPWILAADTQPLWREYRVSSGQRDLMYFESERQRRARGAAQWQDRIDWNRGQAVRAQVHARNEARKAEHHAAKEWRKAERNGGKDFAKVHREDAKERFKFEREQVKEARKFEREQVKEGRKFEREHAREAFRETRPAAAVVREERGRDFARNEWRGGGGKPEERGGGGNGGGRGGDDHPKAHGDGHGGGGGDHGKGHGGGGDKGRGGDGGGKGKGKD
jgi:hypothetical protein